MKVLFATYPMAFHTPGGGEQQLLAYERHLPALGVEVTRFDCWNPRFLEHDLVHFFSTVGGSSHLCAFVKQLGLPLVVSSSLWATEETASAFPIEEIRHQLYLANRVVTNSEIESRTLAQLLGLSPEKFTVVRNAVDPHFTVKADPSEFRRALNVSEDFVLCVGNIEPRKNQLRLAEAMRDIKGVTLVLVGAARDDAYLATVLEAGGSQLRYVGAVTHESPLLASAYAACRVFALPSLYETPGLAALEAAAQGAPIVITREGSTEEYFGPAARYVDPLSVASISSAIRQVLATRSDHSRTPTFAPPTWEDVSAELNEVYRNVLYARAGGSFAGVKANG